MYTSDVQMQLLASALARKISESDTKIKEWFSQFEMSDNNFHALVYEPSKYHFGLTVTRRITGAPNGRNSPMEIVLTDWLKDRLNDALQQIRPDLIAQKDVICQDLLFGAKERRITSSKLDCAIIPHDMQNDASINGISPQDLKIAFEFKTTLTINFEYRYTPNELNQINQNINTAIFDEREEDEIFKSLIIDNDTLGLHKGSTSWGRGDNTKKALGTVAEFSGGWLNFLRTSNTNLDYPPFIIVGNSPPSSIWLKKLKNSTLIGDGNFLTEIWELSPTAITTDNYLAIRNENELLQRLTELL